MIASRSSSQGSERALVTLERWTRWLPVRATVSDGRIVRQLGPCRTPSRPFVEIDDAVSDRLLQVDLEGPLGSNLGFWR